MAQMQTGMTPANEVRTVSGPVAKPRWYKLKRYGPLFIMMAPGLLYLLINNYIPMFGMVIAFKDVNFAVGILRSPWVGFENFRYLFATRDAYVITRNTVLYNAAFIGLNTVCAVGIAILLNDVKNRWLVKFYQSVVLLPFLISFVVVAYLVFAFLSPDTGFMNHSILPLLHLHGVQWYSAIKAWPIIIPVVQNWQFMGFLCVIYFAAVVGIDNQYFEAAALDGANKLQQIRHVTIPAITPVIILMVLLAIGRVFVANFGLFYQVPMNSGAIFPSTNVIDTYVYRGLMQLGDIGMSAAAGFYQSLVGFILVLLSNWIVRRKSADNALF